MTDIKTLEEILKDFAEAGQIEPLFDEHDYKVTLQALTLYIKEKVKEGKIEELQRIWKTAVDHNVAGQTKWEIEDRITELKGEK